MIIGIAVNTLYAPKTSLPAHLLGVFPFYFGET